MLKKTYNHNLEMCDGQHLCLYQTYISFIAFTCCRCTDGDGHLQVKFLKVIPLRDGKAVTIKTALVKYLEENRIAIQNVAGFGSDGAACMIGKLVILSSVTYL